MSPDTPPEPEQDITPATAMALLYLRALVAPIPKDGADLLRINEKLLRRYEIGSQTLSREQLEELVGRIGQPPEAVDLLLFLHELVVPPSVDESASPVALTPEERQRILRTVMTHGWALVREVRAELVRKRKQEKAAAAHRDATELWAKLKTVPREEWRDQVLTFPEYRRWALAVKVCHESERAAAHSAKEALELARLALFMAEHFQGDTRFGAALQAYCWIYIANARRVGNDFDGADADFARAADFWKVGANPDGLLPTWRMLEREAALRREQHQFPEALSLLDRAVAAHRSDALATARLRLVRANILQQMGDFEGALTALAEAAPAIERMGDEPLIFALRFNTCINLFYVERYEEAARRLPAVRALAEQQRKLLDLTRVLWLEAKAMAGLGQKQEAMARLEQVQGTFTAEELPYDAALSGLDLAMLWLEAGRSKEVRQLANAMQWIFRHQRIDREALAALKLFCDAARQEAATVELAGQVSADIEKVMRSASRPGNAPGGRG